MYTKKVITSPIRRKRRSLQHCSTKSRLLLGIGDGLHVGQSVLCVELDADGVVGGAPVQATTLDASDVGHDLQLGVEAGAAGAAEEVLVDLAAVALGVVGLGGALGDLEVAARDDDVGGVCGAGPLLAVGAVAEGGGGRFT